MQRLFFVTTPLAQRVMLLGFAFIIAVLFGTTMRTDTASAAYLDEYCSFELSKDAGSITAECTDDEGNGTIDGATFTSVNEVYVLVQSGESQVRCTRATNNSECPPTDESESLSCKSTITLDKQTNAIGYVDGEYLTKERGDGGGVVVNSKCSPLLSDGTYKKKNQAITISISRYRLEQIKTKTNNALISSFKDRFESQCESEVEGVPTQGGQRETAYNDCVARYRKAITTCNGAAMATFQLNEFFDTDESKENYKKLLKNCFEDEAFNIFSQNQKNNAASAAVAAIGKTESENPSLEADYPGATGNNATDENTSCAIDGIGWMICPVMNFLADANEKAFGFLQSLLEIRPSLVQDEATVDAWSRFRDLANIAFVIAFLVIIYSQITSVGISNYGIKKLLPKIAASAILVNLSLFICQVLVDVSNITGASLYSFIENIAPVTSATADDSSWTNVMTGLLAAGVTVLLIAAIVLAPTVLLALGLILLILVARQAFILILVVIAPLAFVAYLLPNTEQWFKKWWKALSAMLLVYPIIAVVFGASTLASNILMRIADGTSGEEDSQLLAIVALGVMAIPLFAVPTLLKGAMAGAGSIGAKLANLQDRANRRASGDVKNRAGKEIDSLRNMAANRLLTSNSRRARAAAFITGTRRKAKREARYKDNEALRNAAEESFIYGEGTKTAERKARVTAAQETAGLNKQIVENQAKKDHLDNNHSLHSKAGETSLDLHNAEETHKNNVGAEHMRNNPNQYQELNISRGDKKNAELESTLRFEDSTAGKRINLAGVVTEAQIGAVKATNNAQIEELKAGVVTAGNIGDPVFEQAAIDLSNADTTTRVQTQRSANAQKVANVTYAEQVGQDSNNPTQLAVEAAGIAGQAGVSQAQAKAFQTIVNAYSEGVAAEKTLLSQVDNSDLLEKMNETDFLDQPEEVISAVAGTIAGRQHQESHIKLWSMMGQMSAEANSELETAVASGDTAAQERANAKIAKIKNMQQQVMGDKKKIPFGVGDGDQGAADIGTYSGNILESTRNRISTHMSAQKLSTMDPDDMRLIFEMAREGKLSDDQLLKIATAYQDWEKDPMLKSSLQDKHRKLLNPILEHASTGTPTYPPSSGEFKAKYEDVSAMSAP